MPRLPDFPAELAYSVAVTLLVAALVGLLWLAGCV